MDYKTILVHLDADNRAAARIAIAQRLAETFGSHLTGLFALSAPLIPAYALAEAGSVVLEADTRYRTEASQKAEAMFRAATANLARAAEFRTSMYDALAATLLSARYADLVVAGQPEPGSGTAFSGSLVLGAGRPVLLVPYAGQFAQLGRRVLVAWNAGREAARAVADALPFLARSSIVHLIAFNPTRADHGEIPGADIALVLARHGVEVSVAQHESRDVDVGNQILSRAADLQSDLIVMGAYGHSRLRELVLGGVTRTLLASMTVPVLMSH